MKRPADPSLAFGHSEALAHVIAEFLRFGREGQSTPQFPFGLDDVTAILVEALHFALTIEHQALIASKPVAPPLDSDAGIERDAYPQLISALARWCTDTGAIEL